MYLRKIVKKEGISLERTLEQMVIKGENIKGIENKAPLIYTPKKDGVLAPYNPRTDRFEVGLDALIGEQEAKERLMVSKLLQNAEREIQEQTKVDTSVLSQTE